MKPLFTPLDLLRRDLKVVFRGSAAGSKSAAVGAYYARPGNAFWTTVYRVGLTPHRLAPGDFRELVNFEIGLTDLWKETSGPDSEVTSTYADVGGLRSRIRRHAPRALAFNGKSAAKTFLGPDTGYGRQPETIGETAIFVLPSTSGAARGSWDESKWRELADWVHTGVQLMASRKPSSAEGLDRLVDRGQEVDRLINTWFQRSGAELAKPKDLMPYLIQQGFFSKDHREGYPLRRLLNQLQDAGKLSVITTAGFDQKAKNKNWYFVRP